MAPDPALRPMQAAGAGIRTCRGDIDNTLPGLSGARDIWCSRVAASRTLSRAAFTIDSVLRLRVFLPKFTPGSAFKAAVDPKAAARRRPRVLRRLASAPRSADWMTKRWSQSLRRRCHHTDGARLPSVAVRLFVAALLRFLIKPPVGIPRRRTASQRLRCRPWQDREGSVQLPQRCAATSARLKRGAR